MDEFIKWRACLGAETEWNFIMNPVIFYRFGSVCDSAGRLTGAEKLDIINKDTKKQRNKEYIL